MKRLINHIKYYLERKRRKPLKFWDPSPNLNLKKKTIEKKVVNYAKNTEKELESLETMANNWKNYYIKQIDPKHSDYNKTLLSDFSELISQHHLSYIDSIKKFPENELTYEKENKFCRNLSNYLAELKEEIEILERHGKKITGD